MARKPKPCVGKYSITLQRLLRTKNFDLDLIADIFAAIFGDPGESRQEPSVRHSCGGIAEGTSARGRAKENTCPQSCRVGIATGRWSLRLR